MRRASRSALRPYQPARPEAGLPEAEVPLVKPRLGSRVRIPSPAPVSHLTSFLHRSRSRQKAQVPGGLAVGIRVLYPERYAKPLPE
jgi:hypothetical protein